LNYIKTTKKYIKKMVIKKYIKKMVIKKYIKKMVIKKYNVKRSEKETEILTPRLFSFVKTK